jgi:hypothetical protein
MRFLSGTVFANCDVVSTHIDASLLDALPPALLAETLVVWNTREPFERLQSEYSHNWLWDRVENRGLQHLTFDEFVKATYKHAHGEDAAATAYSQQVLRAKVGRLPSMVLRHAGLRLNNPVARRLVGFTAYGQQGADAWASAPVPPGQPLRPRPGQTGPIEPGIAAWDTDGPGLLAAAIQRLETRICAVVVTEHFDDGLRFLHYAMGWAAPPAVVKPRNAAARLGRVRNITDHELAAARTSFAASDTVDLQLHQIALARHHLQQETLGTQSSGYVAEPSRNDARFATIPLLRPKAAAAKPV